MACPIADWGLSGATTTTGVANNSNEGQDTPVDRFGLFYFGNEGGAATVSQDTTVPSDTTYGKFSKSLKIDVTTADTSLGATGSHAIKQTIESSYIHHSGWDYTSSSSKKIFGLNVISLLSDIIWK